MESETMNANSTFRPISEILPMTEMVNGNRKEAATRLGERLFGHIEKAISAAMAKAMDMDPGEVDLEKAQAYKDRMFRVETPKATWLYLDGQCFFGMTRPEFTLDVDGDRIMDAICGDMTGITLTASVSQLDPATAPAIEWPRSTGEGDG
jgi:hypothetical protein